MFKSTTLRLTGWYLLILMSVTVIFSFAIYKMTAVEFENRIHRFQDNILLDPNYDLNTGMGLSRIREVETAIANNNLASGLLYVDLFILLVGGIGSYILAKKQLAPLEKAHESQAQFTSDASHELRTPLAVMKTEIEVALKDPKVTKEELADVLKSNLDEVNKLSKLSEMLLHMSRLDHDKLTKQPTDINDLVIETSKSFGHESSRIETNLSKKQAMTSVNDVAISELFKILIDNALKYSPTNSKVIINTQNLKDCIKISISNEGKGIAKDKLPHIFDRFYRADDSRTSSDKKGFGLGLALAKKIVELHDGELSAISTENVKTTFSVKIPKKNNRSQRYLSLY